MDLIIGLFCLLSLLFVTLTCKDRIKKRIGQVYYFLWMSIIILSTLNLNDLYSVSANVKWLVLLHLISFSLGFLPRFHYNLLENKVENNTLGMNVFSSRGIVIISWCAIIPITIVLIRYLKYASVVGAGLARIAIFTAGMVFKSTTESQLYTYLGYTYFFIMSFLLIFGIMTRKIKLRLLIPGIIGVVMYLVAGSGRLDYITLFCIFFIVLIYTRYNLNVNKKLKRRSKNFKFIFIGIGIFILIVIVTGKRFGIDKITQTNAESLVKLTFLQFYTYMVGPLRALDYALSNYISSIGFNFGRMTFGAIDEIIGWGFTAIGINYNMMNFSYGGITQSNILIGSNYEFNALYTALFHFYFDFGIIGVLAFSLTFGLVLNYYIKRVEKSRSLPCIIILCLLFFTMIMLPISWKLSAPSTLIIIVICMFWDKKCRHKFSHILGNK